MRAIAFFILIFYLCIKKTDVASPQNLYKSAMTIVNQIACMNCEEEHRNYFSR